MSDPTSVEDQLQILISEYYTLSILRYGFIATSFLLAYDIILTLDVEISQIWKQKFTGATVLYLVMRYIYPISQIMELIFLAYPLNDLVSCCSTLLALTDDMHRRRTKDILETFVITLAVILIFTIRTWAIFQRSWIVLIFVGLFGAAKVAANIVDLAVTESYGTLVLSCGFNSGNLFDPTQTALCHVEVIICFPVNKASGYLSLAFDNVIFWLTFYKTIRVVRQMRKLGMTKSITYWILRDGIMYYLGRMMLLVFDLVTLNVTSSPFVLFVFTGTLNNALSNIMINRMILGLRQVSNTHVSGGLSEKSLPNLGFAANSFIGNLGAPLRQRSDDLFDDLSDDLGLEEHTETGTETPSAVANV
ncbi:hypothetical protein BD410DRAFT_839074 [Rickenella mellea]|uniref:DUF6533 domain-containing protein n=1 Tax=Rickenella mellea TaxID=50990 RepID=A0A4Y7Q7R1_9AGAM|nr:hypothetical protein BD410DRAFT_839074 [Rickenella mellea]